MSDERVERRLAALLATDVAGYSRLMAAPVSIDNAAPKKRKGTPRPGNGGRRRGAGHLPEFVPNDSMRSLVKMHLAMREYTYAELCEVLINPVTGAPISVDTFARVFSKEIKIAKIEIDTIAMRPSPAKRARGAAHHRSKSCLPL